MKKENRTLAVVAIAAFVIYMLTRKKKTSQAFPAQAQSGQVLVNASDARVMQVKPLYNDSNIC